MLTYIWTGMEYFNTSFVALARGYWVWEVVLWYVEKMQINFTNVKTNLNMSLTFFPSRNAVCQNTVQEWIHVRILRACENTQRKQDKGFGWPQFLPNTELFLECTLVLLPGVVHRSEFTSAVVMHIPL